MKILCGTVVLAALLFGGSAGAQTPQTNPPAETAGRAAVAPLDRLLGEVSKIDLAGQQITLKTATGNAAIVRFDKQTLYRRVAAGETNLDKASVIKVEEIQPGDKVLARGKMENETLAARVLVVISQRDIGQMKERERLDWLKRGLAGTITAIDPKTKEIMLSVRANGQAASQVVVNAAGEKVRFRRYAPDSILFSDAQQSSFQDLLVGDQLRALGEQSTDGSRFMPEEIVSGSFRTIGGMITAVDGAKNEITIKDIQTQQPLVVVITKNSKLRRLPAELVKLLEASRPSNGGANQAGNSSNGAVGASGNAGRRNDEDVYKLIESLPPIGVADLKPGEGILVSTTKGANPARANAILVAAGAESFLQRRTQQASRPGFNLDLSLPGITP
ncbi:MAG TPA: hypothetical protein VGO96_10630 [Pyrinomonadaceae bacterium]|jgi:hypothetical protein|nr:hypothetical protein [Pyrinomonadaceae bacterium]